MTKKDKIIAKVMESPPRKDVMIEDAIKVLGIYEFDCVRISSSHYNFKNKKYPQIELHAIPVPHGKDHKNGIKRPYLENIQNAINEYIELEGVKNENQEKEL